MASTSDAHGGSPGATAEAAMACAVPRLQTYAALVAPDADLADARARALALATLDEVSRVEALCLPAHLLARLFVLRPRRLPVALNEAWGTAGPPPPLPAVEVGEKEAFASFSPITAGIQGRQNRVAALIAAAAALGERLATAPADDPDVAVVLRRLWRRADDAVGALVCPALRVQLPEPAHGHEHARPGLEEAAAWSTANELSRRLYRCNERSGAIFGAQGALTQLADFSAALPACPAPVWDVLASWEQRCAQSLEECRLRAQPLFAEAASWRTLYPVPDDLEELLDVEIARAALARG